LDLYRNGKKESIHVRCANNTLNVRTDSGEQVKLDLDGIISKLKGRNTPSITLADQDKLTLTQASESGRLKVGVFLSRVYGYYKEDGKTEINSISYVLMLKFNG
jgi:hypothetical protein